ncbi:hypothetical protein [Nocardiopsis sp. NPDC006938]|uniref:hypothetical protein n=1 Tax=Nocardiopsis sp. NPDC006938 TaxID=3364337 RepID=UPI0036BC9632
MIVQTHALPLLGLLLQSAALVLLVLGAIWSFRRKRFTWSERALAREEPTSAERRPVRAHLRDGTVAPDPALAHLTVRAAEHRVRRLDNPWLVSGASVNCMGISLFSIHYSYPGPVLWMAFALFPVALCAPFVRQVALDRARRALEANRELAALHVVVPEEPAAPRER